MTDLGLLPVYAAGLVPHGLAVLLLGQAVTSTALMSVVSTLLIGWTVMFLSKAASNYE